MNKSAKILCIAAILLFVMNSVKAQYYYFNEVNKISLGVNVGTNMASTSGFKATVGQPRPNGGTFTEDFKSKSKFGFKANLNVDYNFPNGFLTLSTGLGADTKNIKIDGATDRKINAYFLTLPIHLLYSVPFGNNNTLKIGGGPYVAYGLGGSYKNSTIGEDYNTFRGDRALMQRWDFGVGLSARVTFTDIFQVTLGYDLGMVNMFKSTEERLEVIKYHPDIAYIDKIKFNALYLTVGVKLF